MFELSAHTIPAVTGVQVGGGYVAYFESVGMTFESRIARLSDRAVVAEFSEVVDTDVSTLTSDLWALGIWDGRPRHSTFQWRCVEP
jgi:hypothetical protein